MNRRTFIKQTTAALGALSASDYGVFAATAAKTSAKQVSCISMQKKPLAIAMWDFSWLLRHYGGGEFENWDSVLDGLVVRGYNAIRADAFPALVAADNEGKIQEEYYFPRDSWKPVMWGNQYSMRARPREGLLTFLPKCRDRGIFVGLATWFMGPGVERVEGLDGFVRVWDETLTLINDHKLMDNVLYVDLLNEYPLYHGFEWLKKKLDSIKTESLEKIENPQNRQREANEWAKDAGGYNAAQQEYFRNFMSEAILQLRAKWPQLDFFASLTTSQLPWESIIIKEFDALDIHVWYAMNDKLTGKTGYWENIHELGSTRNDNELESAQKNLTQNWLANRAVLDVWMGDLMTQVAAFGRQFNVPYGNTEGWGLINWLDHPSLNWDIIKESGEFCARRGAELGYRFNCSSNFTHPQFPRLWQDVAWHKKVTAIIRGD